MLLGGVNSARINIRCRERDPVISQSNQIKQEEFISLKITEHYRNTTEDKDVILPSAAVRQLPRYSTATSGYEVAAGSSRADRLRDDGGWMARHVLA